MDRWRATSVPSKTGIVVAAVSMVVSVGWQPTNDPIALIMGQLTLGVIVYAVVYGVTWTALTMYRWLRRGPVGPEPPPPGVSAGAPVTWPLGRPHGPVTRPSRLPQIVGALVLLWIFPGTLVAVVGTMAIETDAQTPASITQGNLFFEGYVLSLFALIVSWIYLRRRRL